MSKTKKSATKSPYDKIRKPTAPPTIPHKDKKKYKRLPKHKKKLDTTD
jgi:hypothetical protein